MTEYLPIGNQDLLYVDGPRNTSNSTHMTKLRTVYREVVPEFIRTPLYKLRKGYPGKYPTEIQESFRGIDINFFVTNIKVHERARNLSYERKFLNSFFEVISQGNGDVFWDVGAHFGVWTILAAKKQPDLKIVSFEPEVECSEALSKNISLNQLDQQGIERLPIAITNEKGITSFYSSGLEGSAASVCDTADHLNEVEVESHSVDTLVDEGIALAPTIMKVDIEGGEVLLVDGMNKYLPQHLFIELHPEMINKCFDISTNEVWEKIISKGYQPVSVGARRESLLCHFELKST